MKEMWIENTWRFHLAAIRITKINKTISNSFWQECGVRTNIYCWWKSNLYSQYGNQCVKSSEISNICEYILLLPSFRCQYHIRLLAVPSFENSSFIGISLKLALRLKMQYIQRSHISPEISTNKHHDSSSESEQVINCGTFSPSSQACPDSKICKSPVFTGMTWWLNKEY